MQVFPYPLPITIFHKMVHLGFFFFLTYKKKGISD